MRPTRIAHHGSDPATLWEEGRLPGSQVIAVSSITTFAVAALNIWWVGRLSMFFDATFVVLCLASALAVRPREFNAVAVLPPFLMLATVVIVSIVARTAVADEVDSLRQAVVSGLVHHAGGLVAGYAAALGVLAIRVSESRR